MTYWRLQEVEKLTAALADNTTLEEFTACNQVLSVDDARCFASALRSNSTLRSLGIGHSTFGNEAVAALAEGLSGAVMRPGMGVNNHNLAVMWMPSIL